MGNTAKLAATLSLAILLLTACGKKGDSGSGGYKYPRNFPQECVAVYDRWWVFIDKMEASGRFTQESIKRRKGSFEGLLEGFKKNPPGGRTPPVEGYVHGSMEEYILGCKGLYQIIDRWEKSVANMETMSNEELARSVSEFLGVK